MENEERILWPYLDLLLSRNARCINKKKIGLSDHLIGGGKYLSLSSVFF